MRHRRLTGLLVICLGLAVAAGLSAQAQPGQNPSTELITGCGKADALLQKGQFAEAEAAYRTLLPGLQTLPPQSPLNFRIRNNFALSLSSQGKTAEAEAAHRSTIAVLARLPKPDKALLLVCKNNLGEVLFTQRKYREAEAVHREVYTQRQTLLGKEDRDTLVSGYNLASTLLQLNRRDEAREISRFVAATARRTLGSGHPYTPLFEKLDQKL